MNRIITLIEKDELRVKALDCVRQLNLPHCYLAAGFVRNLVWDHLHQKLVSTPLNDVDVIYFDETESNPENLSISKPALWAIFAAFSFCASNFHKLSAILKIAIKFVGVTNPI